MLVPCYLAFLFCLCLYFHGSDFQYDWVNKTGVRQWAEPWHCQWSHSPSSDQCWFMASVVPAVALPFQPVYLKLPHCQEHCRRPVSSHDIFMSLINASQSARLSLEYQCSGLWAVFSEGVYTWMKEQPPRGSVDEIMSQTVDIVFTAQKKYCFVWCFFFFSKYILLLLSCSSVRLVRSCYRGFRVTAVLITWSVYIHVLI